MKRKNAEKKLLKLLTQHNFCILTAENPQNIQLPKSTNKILNDHLESYLEKCDIIPLVLRGDYGGIKENSFLLLDISPYSASQIGKKYHQESVITNDSTVYPNCEIIIDKDLQENYSIITIDDINIKFQLTFE